MDKFRQFLTELSASDMSGFSFPDNNLSKYLCIFTKLCGLILLRSALGMLMGKFHQFLTELFVGDGYHNYGVLFHVFIPTLSLPSPTNSSYRYILFTH